MLTSMARLPLHTLPTFRTVARLENLRAAADELHLTHSAVSQQIRVLEEQIGFQLFDRRGRSVALNAAGGALLRSVEPALAQLDDGLRAAAAAAGGAEHRIRLTVLPSFAQRWLLPRMSSWRERHPDIGIELHASQQVVDLQREGFHAALRQGSGTWRGLVAERLIDSPLIAVGSPNAARRLLGRAAATLADEPLLGNVATWERWFELAGRRVRVIPVAAFNDAGLMLQAAEQDLGLALVREVLAADALRDGRLYRLAPLELQDKDAYAYWLVYPPGLKDWPPLAALRTWLADELARSRSMLAPIGAALSSTAETRPAGRTGNRSRALSARSARGRAR
jgi:LysR family glycine cleavage system transcriptional activator